MPPKSRVQLRHKNPDAAKASFERGTCVSGSSMVPSSAVEAGSGLGSHEVTSSLR